MPVAFADHVRAVQSARRGAGAQLHFLRAQAHGATEVGFLAALLRAQGLVLPLGDHRDDRVRCGAIKFSAMRAFQPNLWRAYSITATCMPRQMPR